MRYKKVFFLVFWGDGRGAVCICVCIVYLCIVYSILILCILIIIVYSVKNAIILLYVIAYMYVLYVP